MSHTPLKILFNIAYSFWVGRVPADDASSTISFQMQELWSGFPQLSPPEPAPRGRFPLDWRRVWTQLWGWRRGGGGWSSVQHGGMGRAGETSVDCSCRFGNGKVLLKCALIILINLTFYLLFYELTALCRYNVIRWWWAELGFTKWSICI